jgi:hypothetical protein
MTVEKEDPVKYKVMAPPSRASGYYCDICDRTLVPGANLQEHKVGTIHRGLMEAVREDDEMSTSSVPRGVEGRSP